MGVKKETWLKIFGWLEIVIGGFGTFLLTLCSLLLLVTVIGLRKGQAGDFGLLGTVFFTVPCPFLLWLGISTLKAKPLALRITAWMPILVFVFIALLLFFGGAYPLAIIVVATGLIFKWLHSRSKA